MRRELRVRVQDGRALDVLVDGPEDGLTLVFHSGTPAAGIQHEQAVSQGASRGVRHVTYSRPGYANSDRHAGRSVSDCVSDVTAIVDALSVGRFFTVGLSGGGPHALACAALMPERVIAAATIGTPAPLEAKGLDWLAGMGEDNLAEYGAARESPDALFRYLQAVMPGFAEVTAADLAGAFGDLVSEVDRDAVTDELADFMAATVRRAVGNGIWGWYDDDLAFVRPWGFDPAAIPGPLTIWHGVHDRFVPPSHAEWLASHIPSARLELRPEHGHLSLWTWGFGDVLDGLLAGQ